MTLDRRNTQVNFKCFIYITIFIKIISWFFAQLLYELVFPWAFEDKHVSLFVVNVISVIILATWKLTSIMALCILYVVW